MVLEATTTDGHRVAMVTALPPTSEDVSRLSGLCALPGLAGAEWTAREGMGVR
jgi:hypothetical protein